MDWACSFSSVILLDQLLPGVDEELRRARSKQPRTLHPSEDILRHRRPVPVGEEGGSTDRRALLLVC